VRYGKPVIVMEPVKGGSLVKLPPEAQAVFDELEGGYSNAAYAIRFTADFPAVAMVLSGMGNMDMMQSNIQTMHPFIPLNDAEIAATDRAREIIRKYKQIPCTKCKYCAEVCPKQVPIADLFATYNENALARISRKETLQKLDAFEIKAADCIGCGACEGICPQNIAIREHLAKLAKMNMWN
jgi:predicted aldo/keto reductase-like oxidoreductase